MCQPIDGGMFSYLCWGRLVVCQPVGGGGFSYLGGGGWLCVSP